jgi:hypothetical protein
MQQRSGKQAAIPEDDLVDEITGDFAAPGASDEVATAVALMSKNQALLTALLAERDSPSTSLTGGGGGQDSISLKGPGLMLRRRRAFNSDPLASWSRINQRMMELLHADEGEPWSAERYGRELVPFGQHRLARRSFFLLAKLHAAARAENMPMVKGLITQGLKFYERLALDNGNQESAVLLLPYEEVNVTNDRPAPPISQQDPFAGLVDPEEAALTMRYLTDLENYNAAKLRRSKGAGKSKDKDKSDGTSDGKVTAQKK